MILKNVKSIRFNQGLDVKTLYFDSVQVWKKEDPEPNYLTFTGLDDSNSIVLNNVGSKNVEYRTYAEDSGWSDWQTYSTGSAVYPEQDEKVQFRGTNTTFQGARFNMTGTVAASGSIMTLLDPTDTSRNVTYSCFSSLFSGCSSLVSAPELPATTVGSSAYSNMFQNCTRLVRAPDLPAENIESSCYAYMFIGCSSLEWAPELPATTIYNSCYNCMFQDCVSLKHLPTRLPATILQPSCYWAMFQTCKAAENWPDLPAEIVPANAYRNMFNGNEKMTVAPQIKAKSMGDTAMRYMFGNCTSLSSVTVEFENWTGYNGTQGWLDNVSPTGTFTCPAALPQVRDVSHIPADWTIVTT